MPEPEPSAARTKGKHRFSSVHRSEALLDGVDIWMGDHLGRFPVLVENQSRLPHVVFGLSFIRSQPDLEGFLRALRFPPSSKSTPCLIHLAVVLWSEVIHGSCSGTEHPTGCTAPLIRLVELRPSQFSLRLRERAISRSDITKRAVRAHRHIEIAIARATARYEPNLF